MGGVWAGFGRLPKSVHVLEHHDPGLQIPVLFDGQHNHELYYHSLAARSTLNPMQFRSWLKVASG